MPSSNSVVSSFGSLNAAIQAVDATSTAGTYTITIDGPITETSDPEAINLNSGVSLVIAGSAGGSGALNGGEEYRGLFVYQGDVTIENMTIENAAAKGGSGGAGGGGGGAGLGGGLFIAGATEGASGGVVTLASVTFTNDSAIGGAGGRGLGGYHLDGGGGGGLGGAGGAGFAVSAAGGGGIGSQAAGGTAATTAGGAGIVPGAAGGGASYFGNQPGSDGGGGAGSGSDQGQPGGGGGVGGATPFGRYGNGGAGGFGGGGGASDNKGGHGGFGGGGGGGFSTGGAGGFGGGGAGGQASGAGGFGAGNGGNGGGGGGGGLGAGGDIFVQTGGSLIIEGGTLGTGTIAGGAGGGGNYTPAGAGSSFGSAIFYQGTQAQTLAPASGATISIGGISDQAGDGGAATLVINGQGAVDLTAPSTYTGGTTIDEGTLILGAAGAAGSGGITFGSGDPPFLEFSLAAAPTNVISGFISGDTIDVTDLDFADITSTSLNTTTDVLSVDYAEGGPAPPGTLNLTFSGAYTSGAFQTAYDGASGTDILLCYLRGTNILTPTGETKVETLGIGDRVVTRFGGIRKIKWIGRQSHEAARASHKIPIRIRAGGLAEGVPARDLYISPGHSMLIGDTLVLATALLNGITITQELPPNTPQIEYFQIELDTHDCIIAEGAWSETFADGPGLRGQYDNAAEYDALYPNEPPPESLNLCAPRPESGPPLEAALRPVVARAASLASPGPLEGYVERASAWKIEGWAFDYANPDLPVCLEIFAGDEMLGTVLAHNHRPDLRQAGKGRGACAFRFTTPKRLADALPPLKIRRAGDGAELPLSAEILGRIAPPAGPPAGLRLVA